MPGTLGVTLQSIFQFLSGTGWLEARFKAPEAELVTSMRELAVIVMSSGGRSINCIAGALQCRAVPDGILRNRDPKEAVEYKKYLQKVLSGLCRHHKHDKACFNVVLPGV